MKKFLKDWALGIVGVGAIIGGLIFGTPALLNLHKIYLRVLTYNVAKITNEQGNSGATGFVARGKSGHRYFITNQHVCNLAKNSILYADYRGDRFPVQVFKSYTWSDLCALDAHRPLGYPAFIASSVRYGEQVYAIGHPYLEPYSVTSGEISGTLFTQIVTKQNPAEGECTGPTYSQIDTSDTMYAFFGIFSVCVRTLEANTGTTVILPGNSGSPLVNIWGAVVGVMFAANEAGTRSYNVTLEDLKDFLGQL